MNANFSTRFCIFLFFSCSKFLPHSTHCVCVENRNNAASIYNSLIGSGHLPEFFARNIPSTHSISFQNLHLSYVYWTVHHLDSWIKRDKLDVTCFIISLFSAQHVSDVNTSILRSLRLICWVISWVVLLWYDVCWCYVLVWLGWYGIRMQAEAWDFPPVQTGPGAHPASCKLGTRSFLGVKCGRGVLTTHPLLVPRSWKSSAIPLPTLWGHTEPLTGTLYLYFISSLIFCGVLRDRCPPPPPHSCRTELDMTATWWNGEKVRSTKLETCNVSWLRS